MLPSAALSFGSCVSLAAPSQCSEKTTLQLAPRSTNTNSNFNGGLLPKPLFLTRSKRFQSIKTPVVVSNQLGSSEPAEKEVAKKYYFVVANANFMLDEEENFQEQMSERPRLFEERNMEQDFWIVIEPKFLDKFPNITKRLKRPAVALVSTNGTWITFMKLRLDRVLTESFEADSLEEALASTPTKIEFKKPANWVAPYQKYEFGWWEPFLPGGSGKSEAQN
ncbi:Protein ycf54 [Ranunculus cassubicifolius]